jgi:hypothetical protein
MDADGGGGSHYQCDYKRAKRLTKLKHIIFGRRSRAAGRALRVEAMMIMALLLVLSIGSYVGGSPRGGGGGAGFGQASWWLPGIIRARGCCSPPSPGHVA